MLAQETETLTELERSVYAALETYSNVHRGSGHNSVVSTRLFEQARNIILEYLGLDKDQYVVIFCTPRRAEALRAQLRAGSYRSLSSEDTGLPLGVRALAVERKALPGGAPFQPGGGTVRLVYPDGATWAAAPDKFEAGTPAIVNVIAFARALQSMQRGGVEALRGAGAEEFSATEILYHDDLDRYSGRDLLDELRKTLVGRGVRVPTREGEEPYANLDNGASTPTFAPVWEAARRAWRQPKQAQADIVREAKSICAGFLGARLDAYEVIFTSNTTEALNLAAESLRNETWQGMEPVILNTVLEHNSNELPWRTVTGALPVRLGADAEGFIDLDELETTLRAYNEQGKHGKKRIVLAAVSGASNVLGSFNDLGEIGRIAHRYGARLLVDGAQLIAHRKVEMEKWGIDYLACTAHKAYAPFGVGVLIARKGLLGFSAAEMESINASGEENAGGIAALGKALTLLQRIGMDVIREEERALTGRALDGLGRIAGVKVYGVQSRDSARFERKGGVISFSLEGFRPGAVGRELAEAGGIGVRYGCHCAHILVKGLLGVDPRVGKFQGMAMNLFPNITLPGVVRVSLGIENDAEDIDRLLRALGKMARKPGNGKNGHNGSTHNGTPVMEGFVEAAIKRVYCS